MLQVLTHATLLIIMNKRPTYLHDIFQFIMYIAYTEQRCDNVFLWQNETHEFELSTIPQISVFSVFFPQILPILIGLFCISSL